MVKRGFKVTEMNTFLNLCEVFLEDGFMYAILAMGYYISYTILDFPDLTVEGTVLTGGAIFAILIKAGLHPWLALFVAFIVGAVIGCLTGFLHVKLKIRPLLCGILVSTALITVNLVVTVLGMGGTLAGDGQTTIPIGRGLSTVLRVFPATLLPENVGGVNVRKLVTFFLIAVLFKLLLDLYLKTKSGMMLRATGSNSRYTTSMAQNPDKYKVIGLAIGNAYAAVSGALIVQSRGNVNQGMGIGMIVIGLASLIIGLSVFGRLKWMKPTTMVIFGAVIYQACLSVATVIGIPSAYNKLLMAILFTVALVVSTKIKGKGGKAYAGVK